MTASTLSHKDLLTISELSRDETALLHDTASRLKREPAKFARALAGKAVVMLFEKPSLRTRVSFEVGIAKLGGHALYYDHSKERIGERESVYDYAKNLERWCEAIVARTYSHEVIEDLARFARVPVINALSDEYHPCQALADLFTLQEHVGPLAGKKLAFIGDGNNVCASLALHAASLAIHVVVINPERYELGDEVAELVRASASASGGSLTMTSDPSAVAGASAIYTDAWTSMGWEAEAQRRRRIFARYQVNAELMARAGEKTLFMHCLPAHRGEEVTDDVIDSPRSIVFDQAENRMHTQNALLVRLLGAA